MMYIISRILICIALAKEPLRVAVIDSGFDFTKQSKHLCKSGHKDFTGEGIEDLTGHGTNVVGLIEQNAPNKDYCIIIIKAFPKKNGYRQHSIEAVQYALNLKVDIVNYSAGGYGFISREESLFKKLKENGVKVIVASGNENLDLDKKCVYYPACYGHSTVIGNISNRSNRGRIVDITIDGNQKTAYGITLSGSSQSTATYTGTLITKMLVFR